VRPLQLRPLQLPNVPDVLRLNVAPLRVNVWPPRDIELKCRPCPPPRGSAFTAEAVSATAAKQLKKSTSLVFIDYLGICKLYPAKPGESRYFSACQ
jgi:hypothetical protein